MSQIQTGTIRTKVPARLDRLPWSRWRAYSSENTLGAPAARPVATLRTAEDTRVMAETTLRDVVRGALGEQARDEDADD